MLASEADGLWRGELLRHQQHVRDHVRARSVPLAAVDYPITGLVRNGPDLIER
jgi:hypothetical protein